MQHSKYVYFQISLKHIYWFKSFKVMMDEQTHHFNICLPFHVEYDRQAKIGQNLGDTNITYTWLINP
jgi:hypothetical protein